MRIGPHGSPDRDDGMRIPQERQEYASDCPGGRREECSAMVDMNGEGSFFPHGGVGKRKEMQGDRIREWSE